MVDRRPVEITVTVAVAAPPDAVWPLFVDVERWPEWTPSMQHVRRRDAGPLRVGSEADVKQPGMPKAVWRVTELEPGRRFTWEVASPGVTTTAVHLVEPDGDGATVTLTVRQSGPLAGLVGLLLGGRIRRMVEQEADGFRRQAERT